jgi:uncharacterized protein YjiS (DUF1127 family)
MTHVSSIIHHVAHQQASLASSLWTALHRHILNWRGRQQVISELGCYSDKELSELGIGRSDVEDVAAFAPRRW